MSALIAANPRIACERQELSRRCASTFKAQLVIYQTESDEDIFIVRVRCGHEDWANSAF
ncbi:hypothetical protein [Sinorhizobium fredii]|uniref:hypothetical protein n=1 Tax=Rhizobium fredii TaxID=380 RepID=UPI003D7C4C02